MNIFVGLKERLKQNFKERKYSQLMMVTCLVVGLGSEAPQEPLIKIFVIKVNYLIHWKMKVYHQVTQERNIIIIIIVIITSVIVLGYLKNETTRETKTFSNYYLISL